MRATFTFLLAIFALTACGPAPQPLKKMYAVPPFTLTERTGQPFDSAALRGKVWVALYFFAHCEGICPLLNSSMRDIARAFPGDDRVRFASFSTDAPHDTPAVLRDYARRFGDDPRWFFFTGSKDALFDLSIHGFKLALVEQPDAIIADQKFIHSTKLVLVDRTGWIRGYYDGLGEQAAAEKARLISDIKRLLEE